MCDTSISANYVSVWQTFVRMDLRFDQNMSPDWSLRLQNATKASGQILGPQNTRHYLFTWMIISYIIIKYIYRITF